MRFTRGLLQSIDLSMWSCLPLCLWAPEKAAALGLLLPQVAAKPHVSRADPGPRRTQSHGGRLGLRGRRGVSGLHSCPKQPGGRSKGLGRLGRDWQRRGRKSGPRGRGGVLTGLDTPRLSPAPDFVWPLAARSMCPSGARWPEIPRAPTASPLLPSLLTGIAPKSPPPRG